MEKYFSHKSHVKLRTNIKDPLTKTYYSAWVILTSAAIHQGGSILLSMDAEAVKTIIVLFI